MSSRQRHQRWCCVVLIVASLAAGCAPKSPDHAVWSDQARHALTDVRGQVATVELVLHQQRGGLLPQNYQQVAAINSEEAVSATADSFSSVQPPATDDATYQRVSSVLSDASDVVSAARIAIVRENEAAYAGLLEDLAQVSDDLAAELDRLNTR